MIRRVARIIISVIGFIAGYQLVAGLFTIDALAEMEISGTMALGISLIGGAILGIILYFITPLLLNKFIALTKWLEGKMRPIPTRDMVISTVGLFVGLLLGYLIGLPIYRLPWIGTYLALFVTLVMGYLGFLFAINRKDELFNLPGLINPLDKKSSQEEGEQTPKKVLDTSVIIDGRIYDICNSGFLEGTLIIPDFVLEELRHIADSSDLLKRNRGRRGLDILNKMQKEESINVQIYEGEIDEPEGEVDSKLVKLAKVMDGKVITNDYNLNKVSELQGVPVLNINELANAVKPVVLPGEEMAIKVIKDGKEAGHGVG